MILILSQALDNTSDDMCVLDGKLLDAAAPEASDAIKLLSEIRQHGRMVTEGSTEITTGAEGIAVKVPTADVDQAGRRAPVMAVFHMAELRGGLGSVIDRIARYTEMLGRSIDAAALGADLARWRDSGKANGGRLSRLRRRAFLAVQRAWRNLLRRLFGRGGAP